jgi:hypothetical protein
VEIEVRVELSGRRKEMAERSKLYISGGGLQRIDVKMIQRCRVCMARGNASIDIVKTVRTQSAGFEPSTFGSEDKPLAEPGVQI